MEEEVDRYRNLVAQDGRRATLNSLATALVHELNQPLTAIMSYAEAARVIASRLPAPHGDLVAILDEIVAGGRRAEDVVCRARGLVKRERHRFRAVDMNAVVEQTLSLTQTAALLRGVRLSAHPAAAPATVQGDPQQLVQVMLNLVANALDAVGEGGSVEVTVAVLGATSVIVAVTDTGPGIRPELLPSVFDAFVSTKEGNLGLGLDIASSIVRAHGGGMWAASVRGGGALVAFALPNARREA
jgi:two-component system sensor kinase FixL